MYYVIMDLEWNNAYSRKHNGFFNEIIEIGAVLADESFRTIDTFSIFIKSQLGKKLSSRVKKLTKISNEDLKAGVTFPRAIKELKKWIGERECVFLSWGNSDVRTLVENYKFFLDSDTVLIMKQYADLQKYCQDTMGLGSANQVGLSAAALQLGIDVEKYETHRALEDCRLSLKCLKKCQDINQKGSLRDYVMNCDDSFYRRLAFKVHNITNIHNPKIDRSVMNCHCEQCGEDMLRLSDWKVANQAFRALFFCKGCNQLLLCSMRFKETFDGVFVITSLKKVEKQRV